MGLKTKISALIILIFCFLDLNSGFSANISIIDDTGQTVAIKSPAKRIVTLYGALTETVCALGFCNRLVGVTKRDNWPEECRKKPKIGTHMRPNLELIVALKPDLVLQGSVRPGSQLVVERLKAIGIPVAIFNPTNFQELFHEIKRIGILCGDTKRADNLIKEMKKELSQLKNRYPLSKSPRVIYEISYPNFLVAGKKNFVSAIIYRAGGENIIKTPKKLVKIGIETIVSSSPDVYIVQKGPMNKLLNKPCERPNFKTIGAVSQNRVLIVDEFTFSRPTPRSVEAVKILRRYFFKYYPKIEDER